MTDLYIFASDWVQRQFKPFSSDDLTEAFIGSGGSIDKPKSIGGVFKRLIDKGQIFKHGNVKAKGAYSRGGVINTYISKEYRLKQQTNATKNKTLNLFENE